MKKMLTALLTILLTAALLAAACPALGEEEARRVENPVTIVEMDTPTDSDAAENYIKRAFGLIGDAPRRRIAALSGFGETLYNALAGMVQDVAAGSCSSTVCEIPFTISSLGVTTTEYTAADLGVTALIVNDQITSEAYSAFCNAVFTEAGFDLTQITLRLKSLLPYDMYWYGNRYGFSFPLEVSWDDTTFYVPEEGTLTIRLFVSSDYSVTGAESTTDYNTSYGTRIASAAAKAKSIVAECAGQPASQQLRHYLERICEEVSYNDGALDPSTPYGDPWQPVFVFDGDSSTNVVCEGYSKAFKYLCDLSRFSGVNVSLMTGYMSGGTGAGPHMWNLVSVGGKNYLVDVTNCDEGTVGAPDKLFMAGYSREYEYDGDWGYVYKANGEDITYIYDREMSDLYAAEELNVENGSYDPSTEGSWTVTYDANGGSGEMEEQALYEYVPVKLNPVAFTPPAGHHFVGWNTEADRSGTDYENEQEITPEDDLTLYAVWEEDEVQKTWTVHFDANDGEGEMEDQIVYDGVQAKLNPNTFTPPAGYHFAGWNTEADGTGDPFEDEQEVTLDDDLILYAVWEEDEVQKTWTVYFEINNGSEDGDMYDQIVDEGVPTKLKPNTFTPPAGYHFVGWNTDPEGNGTGYEDEEEVELYGDLTLYAMWDNDSWIITFVANNGTEDTAEQSIAKNHLTPTALTSLAETHFDAPEHYHFLEWNTKADGTGNSYADGEKVLPEEDLTLYAIWEEDEFHTVSFDVNGGSGSIDPIKVYSPFKVTLPDNTFTLAGCFASGWDTRSLKPQYYYENADLENGTELTLTDDMTLYSHWKINTPWFSLDVIDRIEWTEEPVLRHMAGGTVTVHAVFRYGDETEELDYGESHGASNYTGQGDTTVFVTAVPAENYEFAGWYSAVEESSYNQTLTPVELISEEDSWSFEATGHENWTPVCAVFRFVPPAFESAEFTLPDDVTMVEDSAFEEIKAASVYVPDSCESIGASAFKDCEFLRRIRLPENCEIGDHAFDGCRTDPSTLDWVEENGHWRQEDCGDLLIIYAPAGGKTQQWAKEHHILFAAE